MLETQSGPIDWRFVKSRPFRLSLVLHSLASAPLSIWLPSCHPNVIGLASSLSEANNSRSSDGPGPSNFTYWRGWCCGGDLGRDLFDTIWQKRGGWDFLGGGVLWYIVARLCTAHPYTGVRFDVNYVNVSLVRCCLFVHGSSFHRSTFRWGVNYVNANLIKSVYMPSH